MIEGIIKFNYSCISSLPIKMDYVLQLNKWREILYSKHLVGEYPDKIGFGNISCRVSEGIVITASQTGGIKQTGADHYVLIHGDHVDWINLTYSGVGKPSSESQTHLSIYSTNKKINYIFHVHHRKLWRYMLDHNFTQTSCETEYGTEGMAQEMIDIVRKNDRGIIALGGHEEGIISYGKSGEEAWEELEKVLGLISAD